MREVANILFGAVFTVAVSVALGQLLLERLRVTLFRWEATLIAFLAGAGCLSFGVTLLCFVHQARRGVFLWVGLAAIGTAVWRSRRWKARRSLPAISLNWLVAFYVIFAMLFLYYFVNALAPEISPDGSGYHLGNVARVWRNHGFAWDYHSMYSYFSQGIEMLFLVAFSFGRHSAAALVHFAFLCTLPLLMVLWGRRFGYSKAALFAAIIVFASPVIAKDGISAYNDVAVATLIYAVFYLLQVWDEERWSNLLLIIGLLSGFCYAVKYTAFLTLPFAAVWIWWRGDERRWKDLARLAAPAALTVLPWVLRNWIWLGNPFAPFLNAWFPNPYYHAGMERIYADSLFHYSGIKHNWEIPLQLTVRGGLVGGLYGPVFLLVPLSLLALRFKSGRRLLAAGLVFAVPAYLNADSRFLIPCAPFFAMALGMALANVPGALPALALFQALLCW
ncbi:MAG TPA: glycosyltransferase family 39 protein, partial [Candidatus Solibacter sp.]